MTTFRVITYTAEAGWWIAECPCLPGCMSQGRSRAEALANLKMVLNGCAAVRAECGMPAAMEPESPALPRQKDHLLEVDVLGPIPD
jgi:predicted RNase H-like HicB family nuclease